MQALKVAVVVMGVMIVAGVAVIATVIAGRIAAGNGAPPGARAVSLSAPAGSRIVAAALDRDDVLLVLREGGADRAVLVSRRTGRPVLTIGLAP